MTPKHAAQTAGDSEPPLITIITPTFNRRAMLASTLASVHLQTYARIEHIVIDGGSTDGTIDMLKSAAEQWGVKWVSEPDGGMYEAINKGLKIARGQIVGWINSDDLLLPWTCDAIIDAMRSHAYTCAVYGDVLSVDVASTEATIQFYGQFNRQALATVTTLAQPTVFWPLSVTPDVGPLDTSVYRQIADCDYWLRLSRVIPFRKCREVLALVVNHPATKRRSLQDEIRSEFKHLRASYRPNRYHSDWERVKNALRWRSELTHFLLRNGWTRTWRSNMLGYPPTIPRVGSLLLSHGPLRRYPLRNLNLNVQPWLTTLEYAARSLSGIEPAG